MTTGEALKRFRKEFNLKQGDVADKIEMLQQGYYKYESDRVKMPVDVLVKIAKAYKVSTDYLLGLSDTPRPVQIDNKEILDALEFKKSFKNLMQEHGI